MADVIVVGAGLGGLATAARLAKLGHHVTVFEQGNEPGGLLAPVRQGGFEWDAIPLQTTIPAVLRDLFRKSGRPLERYVDLRLSEPARRHVFPDGSVLDLPTGSRGAQLDAVSSALGPRAGTAWTAFVDRQGDTWELLRSTVLDVPAGITALGVRRTARGLDTRHSLDHLVHKAFDSERLRTLAAYPATRTGRQAASEPALRAVESYVERTFGVWHFPNGAVDLTTALLERMSERSVELRFDTQVTAVRCAGQRVLGVDLRDGESVNSDVVVTAVAPSQVFGSLLPAGLIRKADGLFAPSSAAQASRTTYVGLTGELPALPKEVVLHGDPLLVLTTGGSSPARDHAWTVVSHGPSSGDVLDTMAARGVDIRDRVAAWVEGGRSPYSLGWEGARTAAARGTLGRPLSGLFCLGTGLVLGASIPYVGWQAAHVADEIGKA